MEIYDLIIVGAGCSGASAAMYASRLNLKTLMFGEMPGGLITTTHLVENWPGEVKISGPDLAMKLLGHAQEFGVPARGERIVKIEKCESSEEGMESGFAVYTAKEKFLTKTVLLATGTKHKKMGIEGEERLANKGVSYCALCDGALYRGKPMAVIGGGDSAAKEALLLSEFSPKVYVVCRSTFRPEPVNADRVKANEKIEVILANKPVEVIGDQAVSGLKLNDGRILEVGAVFVAIGHLALSELAKQVGVQVNENGEVKINRRSETSVPGFFAAGDVTDTGFKQAITGSAEAVTAAYYAFEYVSSKKVACG